ncbi:MAG: hypothetical protein ACRDV4_04935 [Acidimicrobiales bacterium]
MATVHYGSDRWIDIQLSYLRRNMSEPYLVWASLEDVPGDHSAKFGRTVTALGAHPGKLNLLAAEISAEAAPQDLIVFLDGDAFPIVDPMPTVRRALSGTRLVAVRRDENAGHNQPHPCFCALTVATWEELHGDWSSAYSWAGPEGTPISDVGGNLLRALERSGVSWTPLLRTNRVDLHPVWFAIYGGVVYHHGSGFRPAMSYLDLQDRPKVWSRGRQLPVVGRAIRRFNRTRLHHWRAEVARSAERLGDEMIEKIKRDPEFYKELL